MGSARANGKTGLTDWDNRPMHKKCLKQHQKDLEFEHLMQDIMETQQTANKIPEVTMEYNSLKILNI